ncbi:hypothetical protein [Tenacibaculum singaporense]|uniref:hypothetical protein n=1 Tax=Tenacibaculum singaporense TaxID=2358479 RepID=UPI000F686D6B|nr:hypothetical protein [Tenacibaculum singaporense]RSC93326.1 hypothetical protein EI424_08840 [Tenacibaculum singaporense]
MIHFIVFPKVYVYILKNNPQSFKFDEYIQNNEKEISLKEVVKEYSPEELVSQKSLVDSIIELDEGQLKKKLEYLRGGNILKIDDFQFYIDIEERELLPGQDSDELVLRFDLKICNKEGILITSINDNYGSEVNYKNTVKSFLRNISNDLKYSLENYKTIRMQIEERNIFWTYDKILPYSINIFNTSNINPKSRLANNIVFLHQILLGIIGVVILFFITLTKANSSKDILS